MKAKRTFSFYLLLFFIFLTHAAMAAGAGTVSQEILLKNEVELRELLSRYVKKLGPDQDPFIYVFNMNEGRDLFQELYSSSRQAKRTHGPLSAYRDRLLIHDFRVPPSFNGSVVQEILDDSRELLETPGVDKLDHQSNLLALKYTLQYLQKFKIPDRIIDRDGKPEDKVKKPGDKPEDKKDEDSNQKPPPPQYPDLPDEYRPTTKETGNKGKGGSQEQRRMVEANLKTPYFALRHFSDISRWATHPFKASILPTQLKDPSGFEPSELKMTVHTWGNKEVTLFLPPGYKPLQPSDYRATLTQTEKGEYILKNPAVMADIQIPLLKDSEIRLSPPLLDVYTQPVGFDLKEWPEDIQLELFRKFKPEDEVRNPLQVAQAISEQIAATHYLYSVGPRKATDPIEALKEGSFQCDMAAYIMIGLLRDVYHIPSRIGGGYRAKRHHEDHKDMSYLVLPNDAHVWVEVFHNGEWHLFDPTPVKKDKKDDSNDKKKDDYANQELENQPRLKEPEADEDKTNPKDDKKSKENAKGNSEQATDKEKSFKDKLKDWFSKTSESLRLREKKTSDNKKSIEKDDKKDGLTREELADQLELGSLDIEPSKKDMPLAERAVRATLRFALDPRYGNLDIQNRLNAISHIFETYPWNNLKPLLGQAFQTHANTHAGLSEWIETIRFTYSKMEVNKLHSQLIKIKSTVELYSQVLDRNGRAVQNHDGIARPIIPFPRRLLELINRALQLVETLNHPDAKDMQIVSDLLKDLPSVPRQMIHRDHGLAEVGPNAQTHEVADLLKKDKLNDLRLLSILSPISEFILNSSPRPEYSDVKTWNSDPLHPTGPDLIPVELFSDMSRALRLQPGRSLEQNLRDQTLFYMGRRKTYPVATGFGKEDAERITIVLYDTSGSMDGAPARFQAALISAFTGRALSDTTRDGRHRHRVVIVPFDEKAGTPVPVTNTDEAIEVIRHYQSKLKNTNGGTNIQNALLQAMALIADAGRKSRDPLAAANIILMTDGQATIDKEALLKARAAFDQRTPLQTLFIAINGTNPELAAYAYDAQSLGAAKGLYIEFAGPKITEILAEADHLDLSQVKKNFYSTEAPASLPNELESILDDALQEGQTWSHEIQVGSIYTPVEEFRNQIDSLQWRGKSRIDRPLETWIKEVRRLLLFPVYARDRELFARVIDDLLTHFKEITGLELGEISDFEQSSLKHLINRD